MVTLPRLSPHGKPPRLREGGLSGRYHRLVEGGSEADGRQVRVDQAGGGHGFVVGRVIPRLTPVVVHALLGPPRTLFVETEALRGCTTAPDTVPLYDEVLPAKTLCHLRIGESDEGKGSERLRNEDVDDFAVVCKEVPDVIDRHVFRATTHEQLPADRRISLFQLQTLNVIARRQEFDKKFSPLKTGSWRRTIVRLWDVVDSSSVSGPRSLQIVWTRSPSIARTSSLSWPWRFINAKHQPTSVYMARNR